MLETGRVGGVPRNGNVDAFVVHDSDAFADIVGTEAANVSPFALGVGDFTDNVQFARFVIELGLNIGEAVDTGNDLGSVFAETIEDDAERHFTSLVGIADDADSAFSSGEGFVTCQEAEAFRFVLQEHSCQVAVAAADFAVFRDGAGNAEGLEADADGFSRFYSRPCIGLDSDGSANGVGPASIFKCNRLYVFDDFIGIQAGSCTDIATFFNAADTVFFQYAEDLINSSVVAFK